MDSTNGKDFVLTDYAKNTIQFKAHQLCQRRDFRQTDQDDLEQELWLTVCERAGGFDPAKASLDTFIDRVINSAVAMILRNRKRLKRVSGFQTQSLDGDGPISPDDLARRTGSESKDPVSERETAEAVEDAIARMPDDLKEICRRLMVGTVYAVAREMNVSRRQVRKAGTAIRSFLERAGFGND